MNMKKLLCLGILLEFLGLLQSTPALAVFLNFVPSSQTVHPGQPVEAAIDISGLGGGGPPSVGAFDLDVSFDPTILSPTGVTFGPFLGNPDLGESLNTFFFLPPGVLNFAEISFLSPSELDALQPDSFTLATLSFNTLAVGISPLTFSQATVLDAFGGDLNPILGSATVEKVPEPATLLLMSFGLTSLILTIGKQRSGKK